jgi:hypothetical protein
MVPIARGCYDRLGYRIVPQHSAFCATSALRSSNDVQPHARLTGKSESCNPSPSNVRLADAISWLYDLLKPHVTKLVACDPRKNRSMREGNQSDKIDARRLAELLRRCKKQLHCDLGRTPFALCHADQGAEQRHGSCRCRIESACSQTPRYPATLADVGSRAGDGQAQDLYSGHGCESLFL